MKRGGALIALTLVLAACGSGTAKGPATHAVVLGAAGPVDVWRDARGRLTFHHVGDHRGEVTRWNPRTYTMDSFAGGALDDSESGLQNSDAWRDVNAWYGVDEATVMSALASGEPSPEPFGFTISSPPITSSPCDTEVGKGYRTDIGKAAAETGFVLPRLTTLAGHPLIGVSVAKGCSAAMTYRTGPGLTVPAEVDIGRYRPGDPGAPGNYYKGFYDRLRHHHGAVDYVADWPSIVFPYHGEWIAVTSFTESEAKAIVRAIVDAPTR